MSYSMDDDFMLSLFGEAGESSKTDNDLPAVEEKAATPAKSKAQKAAAKPAAEKPAKPAKSAKPAKAAATAPKKSPKQPARRKAK